MFTLLDGLNHFLSYFNLKIKVKSRLHIILGIFTTGYIGYLTLKFFRYHALGRGIIYLLIFLILLYFLILNIFYYFFDKNVKWDITPFFEKFAQVENPDEQNKKAIKNKNGVYADRMVIYDETKQNLDDYQAFDTTLDYLVNSQEDLGQLVEFMLDNHLAEKNTKAVKKQFGQRRTAEKIAYEIGSGIEIPSFTIRADRHDLILSIGLNATERVEIARLKEIGNVPADKMGETYDIVAKSATIVGGKYKKYKNDGIESGEEPYTVQLQVACFAKLPV